MSKGALYERRDQIIQQGYKENVFYSKGGETLGQVAQKGGGCPVPGDIQGQTGASSEHPDLVVDVPVHHRGVRPDDL